MTTYAAKPKRSRSPACARAARRCVGSLGPAVLLLLSYAIVSGQEVGQRAVLLKETDRVLFGKVLQRAGFYEIEIAPNSRVSIPTGKVAQVADSLEELYQTKRAGISQTSIGDHFQLTRWCLLNGLLSHAAEHYAIVARGNASHPRVKQLGIELEEQLLRDQGFRNYLGLEPLAQPGDDPKVAVKSQADPAESSVVTASTFETRSALHPKIAQHFADRIEPILLNRCSQAACHGVQGTSSLRLLEPHGRTHAKTAADNLASVLKQVPNTPNQVAPLLHFATQAHGTQRAPAIAVTDAKLVQELQNWIDFVRNPVVSAVATTGNRPDDRHNNSGLKPVSPGGAPLRLVPQASRKDSSNSAAKSAEPAAPQQIPFPATGFPVGVHPPSAAELDALDAQLQDILGESGSGGAANADDPFDPAEFNRKARREQN